VPTNRTGAEDAEISRYERWACFNLMGPRGFGSISSAHHFKIRQDQARAHRFLLEPPVGKKTNPSSIRLNGIDILTRKFSGNSRHWQHRPDMT
jgi:hypothetical protein